MPSLQPEGAAAAPPQGVYRLYTTVTIRILGDGETAWAPAYHPYTNPSQQTYFPYTGLSPPSDGACACARRRLKPGWIMHA